ncbi:C-terminal domain of 1-Cys peroxiredoxin [Parelaphostrongylus tenuis]|uniref:C-terminal domain of 1-Cys peroxiredoxin n=1 Tax=Parelaphostrongylus tenuis TaxID=148309 RepID=A0AAD5MH01_PARTN|nr:C-terminal domain of 1-Cys peroxiredoxin [Parelaphostrongylus tenuis]
MKLGDTFPAFSAVTNLGKIYNFHDWMGDSWAILFSHPADFTPVCTTELARAVQMAGEFNKRQVKMIALSCDSVESHRNWIRDILTYSEVPGLTTDDFPFEIIADEDRKLAIELEMLDPAEKNSAGMALTARAVFIIDPTKKLRAQILYPATTGRDFNEILRVIDSLQLTGRLPVATPEGWKNVKDACMVEPNVAMSKAEALFGEVDTVPLPSGKPYLRRVHIKE